MNALDLAQVLLAVRPRGARILLSNENRFKKDKFEDSPEFWIALISYWTVKLADDLLIEMIRKKMKNALALLRNVENDNLKAIIQEQERLLESADVSLRDPFETVR